MTADQDSCLQIPNALIAEGIVSMHIERYIGDSLGLFDSPVLILLYFLVENKMVQSKEILLMM